MCMWNYLNNIQEATLIVNYYEGGMSFYGIHIIRNGEELSSISGDMSHLAETIVMGEECYCEVWICQKQKKHHILIVQ
jgi:hypothetical protein